MKFGYICETGLKRKSNQDNYHIMEEEQIFIVADGMGGHLGGETASRIAIEEVLKFYHMEDTMDITRTEIEADLNQQRLKNLKQAIRQANRSIHRQAKISPEKMGMGTTIVILQLTEDTAIVAHVGDSRLYRLNGRNIRQVTKDHSRIQELIDSQQVTPEEAAQYPFKNVITRALGGGSDIEVDTAMFPYDEEDAFLLCTDGICGVLSEDEIAELIIGYAGNVELTLEKMAELTNAYGSPDNFTAILIEGDRFKEGVERHTVEETGPIDMDMLVESSEVNVEIEISPQGQTDEEAGEDSSKALSEAAAIADQGEKPTVEDTKSPPKTETEEQETTPVEDDKPPDTHDELEKIAANLTKTAVVMEEDTLQPDTDKKQEQSLNIETLFGKEAMKDHQVSDAISTDSTPYDEEDEYVDQLEEPLIPELQGFQLYSDPLEEKNKQEIDIGSVEERDLTTHAAKEMKSSEPVPDKPEEVLDFLKEMSSKVVVKSRIDEDKPEIDYSNDEATASFTVDGKKIKDKKTAQKHPKKKRKTEPISTKKNSQTGKYVVIICLLLFLYLSLCFMNNLTYWVQYNGELNTIDLMRGSFHPFAKKLVNSLDVVPKQLWLMMIKDSELKRALNQGKSFFRLEDMNHFLADVFLDVGQRYLVEGGREQHLIAIDLFERGSTFGKKKKFQKNLVKAYYLTGKDFELKNDVVHALDYYSKTAKLAPDYRDVRARLKRLNRLTHSEGESEKEMSDSREQ